MTILYIMGAVLLVIVVAGPIIDAYWYGGKK